MCMLMKMADVTTLHREHKTSSLSVLGECCFKKVKFQVLDKKFVYST